MDLSVRLEAPGRIENGVVVLEGPTMLQEGAHVCVVYPASPRNQVAPAPLPVVLPIFPYEGRQTLIWRTIASRDSGSLRIAIGGVMQVTFGLSEESWLE